MAYFEIDESKTRPEKHRHGFQTIYYFSRCVGLWPFTITYHPNGSIKGVCVHLFDKFWFLLSISVYLASLLYYYDRTKTQIHKQKNYLSTLLFATSQMPLLLFGAVGIVMDILNRHRLVNILQKFIIFDRKVCVCSLKVGINKVLNHILLTTAK